VRACALRNRIPDSFVFVRIPPRRSRAKLRRRARMNSHEFCDSGCVSSPASARCRRLRTDCCARPEGDRRRRNGCAFRLGAPGPSAPQCAVLVHPNPSSPPDPPSSSRASQSASHSRSQTAGPSRVACGSASGLALVHGSAVNILPQVAEGCADGTRVL